MGTTFEELIEEASAWACDLDDRGVLAPGKLADQVRIDGQVRHERAG